MKPTTRILGALVLAMCAGRAQASEEVPAPPPVALSDAELDEVAAAGHRHGADGGHGGLPLAGGLDLRRLGAGASPVFVLNLVIALTQQIAIGNAGPVVQIAQNAAQGIAAVGSQPLLR